MSYFSNKQSWDTISGYNAFVSTYYQGDVDISGGDLVLRNGNLYMGATGTIQTNSFSTNILNETSFVKLPICYGTPSNPTDLTNKNYVDTTINTTNIFIIWYHL